MSVFTERNHSIGAFVAHYGFAVRRIRVSVENAHPRAAVKTKNVERLASTVLRRETRGTRELTVVFIGDKETKRLNRQFLHHNRTTDVISFRLDDAPDGKHLEGEVYVNIDQARRQAQAYRVSVQNEINRLVIHGILHLAGYDDRTKAQRSIMRLREDMYLQWKNR